LKRVVITHVDRYEHEAHTVETKARPLSFQTRAYRFVYLSKKSISVQREQHASHGGRRWTTSGVRTRARASLRYICTPG